MTEQQDKRQDKPQDKRWRDIPFVAIAISVVMIGVGLLFAVGFYFNPSGLLPGLAIDSPPMARLVQSMGARSLSMALALLLALLLRNRPALVVVLAMRLLTELQDLLIAISTTGAEASMLVIVPLIMAAEAAAIVLLLRRERARPS